MSDQFDNLNGLERAIPTYKRKTEPAQVKTTIDNFEKCIIDVGNKSDDIINEAKGICTEPQGNKRRRSDNSSHDHRVAALEVCDNIMKLIEYGENVALFYLLFIKENSQYQSHQKSLWAHDPSINGFLVAGYIIPSANPVGRGMGI
ncbi:unnamed protein product [Acanthoscelides obtectus]|uniref:Uncharacterized protein n=1 Tax=Acanthoscelides obtectus TaxID=200917 RepID=A0A9P0LCL6_ACAOB|nr:unnamed protein product [Acanthoscelides obtectus]CAK1638403.1 hypothetical protein AOBTE_LOCUS10586 [Acanthoscelides obtectus]